MKTLLSKYISETSGNIAVMTAVTLPVLLIGIGVAVTFADADERKVTLQNHADVMSLAIAKIQASEDKKPQDYIFKNIYLLYSLQQRPVIMM